VGTANRRADAARGDLYFGEFGHRFGRG
jgi:hypothetical protein